MKRTISIIVLVALLLGVCLSLTSCGSSSSSGDVGILGYIFGIGIIIAGIVMLIFDGAEHGIIYVIGEILMVVLLITFG